MYKYGWVPRDSGQTYVRVLDEADDERESTKKTRKGDKEEPTNHALDQQPANREITTVVCRSTLSSLPYSLPVYFLADSCLLHHLYFQLTTTRN